MDYESNDLITMRFPKDNAIFGEFNNKSLEEQETIIKLGLVMFLSGKDRKITLNNEDWEDKLNDIKKINGDMNKKYDEQIKKYKETIRKMKDDNREEMSNGIKEAKELEKSKFESLLSNSQSRIEKLSEDIESLKKEKWDLGDKMRKDFDEKLDKMRENERIYQEKRDEEYRNTMKDLADKMNDDDKCQVASNKGKVGEESIQKFLTMSLPRADIEDVAQKGGAGDLIIHDASLNIMVEVKNYDSANVKTSEVNKFKKDMTGNTFTGGIFLSMKRGICNIDNWTIDTINCKPVIYLCNVSSNMENIITAYKIIKKLSEINMDWTITEKLKKIEEFVKQYGKDKKKKLKILNNHTRDMTKCIEEEEKKLITLIEFLRD
jgi:hypothetical protein